MRVLKLGTLRLWMTKKRLDEAQVHLQISSSKTVLTASQFEDVHEWFEEEQSRLVRKSVVWARKHAPVFALGQICAVCGEDLDMDTFGTKEIYVKVVGLRPLRIEDPKGKIWNGGLGFRLRKLTVKEEDKLARKYCSK